MALLLMRSRRKIWETFILFSNAIEDSSLIQNMVYWETMFHGHIELENKVPLTCEKCIYASIMEKETDRSHSSK